MQRNDQRSGTVAFRLLLVLFALLPVINSLPVQSNNETLTLDPADNSTESDGDLIELIQRYTTSQPNTTMRTTAKSLLKRRLKLSEQDWRRMTSHGMLITEPAFDTGAFYNPIFAYITEKSYNKYVSDLGTFFS